MTLPMPLLADQQESIATAVKPVPDDTRPPRTARAFVWYLNVMACSLLRLAIFGVAALAGMPDSIGTPAASAFLSGSFHPMMIAVALTLPDQDA